MEENNIKWLDLMAALFYLVAYAIGIWVLASKWDETPALWRFGAIVGLTLALGLAGFAARFFLSLDQTARAFLVVATLVVPFCALALAMLFPGGLVGSVVPAAVAAAGALGVLVGFAVPVVVGAPSLVFTVGYVLLCAPLALIITSNCTTAEMNWLRAPVGTSSAWFQPWSTTTS